MKPNKLEDLVKKGEAETFKKGQTFYALDFKEELYVVKSGYVKRYSVNEEKQKVIESIYGPTYFFPLTPVYKLLFNFNLSQERNTYIYQAMTDLEIQGVSSESLLAAISADKDLYIDLFYEAGRRLRANINRLASNAIKDSDMKVAHQLTYLANEYGEVEHSDVKTGLTIPVPLEPIDMAEQLNMTLGEAKAAMDKLRQKGLIIVNGSQLFVPDLNMLKDAYL